MYSKSDINQGINGLTGPQGDRRSPALRRRVMLKHYTPKICNCCGMPVDSVEHFLTTILAAVINKFIFEVSLVFR
jgi:hypothetical protein